MGASRCSWSRTLSYGKTPLSLCKEASTVSCDSGDCGWAFATGHRWVPHVQFTPRVWIDNTKAAGWGVFLACLLSCLFVCRVLSTRRRLSFLIYQDLGGVDSCRALGRWVWMDGWVWFPRG